MSTRILIAFCVCLASSNVMAQGSQTFEEARIEVSGGYSYLWGDVGKAFGGDDLPKGWNAGFVYYFSEGVGLAVDIAGHHGPQFFGAQAGTVDASLFSYTAGVKMTRPVGKLEYTVRLLGGVANATANPGGDPETNTEVAIIIGGGLNLPLGSRRFGLQLAQVDVLLSGAVREVSPALTVGAFYRW
jgi:hypothetical protein